MTLMDEAQLEISTVDYFRSLGYDYILGPEIAPDGPEPEREDYGQVILTGRLRNALMRINPEVPEAAIDDAMRQVTVTNSPSLIINNRAFHWMLANGVEVSWHQDGEEKFGKVWLIERDPAKLDDNEFLVINQFTIIEDKKNRRPDVVVFINGLPLAVIELKNPANENATIRHAFNQFQTYKSDIPSLFV